MNRPLFNSQVCIDGGIACCASQVLVFSVGNVLSCSVVSVLLRQTKVNKEQLTEKERTHGGYLSVTLHREVIIIPKLIRHEDKINVFSSFYTQKISPAVKHECQKHCID